ncbi:type II toxin-antitoxin system VapC family toxin [Geomonas sp. RF6]|nr:type II toxin-antitoxin system VapC family toxin [Geomonas sp. RF6]UFS72810.1 type II toxin-antitoxin system VapC family toxin [Geomonas sp. RF6]
MVLVDTSVWIDHLRSSNAGLVALLEEGTVLCHPFVVGEVACGNLRQRETVLALLNALPVAAEAQHHEVLLFLERHQLFGKGVGLIDIHLLASAALSGARIWTLDQRVAEAAETLGLSCRPE